MTRKAALTVRLPGARIAPAKSTWTCGHRRLENSGTKGLSRCSIVVGRVRIITSLWRTGDDRTLPLLTLTKWMLLYSRSDPNFPGYAAWDPGAVGGDAAAIDANRR